MKEKISIACIILNYNTKRFLDRLIYSLCEAYERLNAKIVVIDNESTDGSFDYIIRKFKNFADVVLFGSNYGFGGGFMRYLESPRLQYDILIFSNADIFVDKDVFIHLTEVFRSDNEIGAVSPIVCDYNDNQRIQVAGTVQFHPNILIGCPLGLNENYLEFVSSRPKVYPTLGVTGCFFAIRRDVVEEIGGFDPHLFMYGGEADIGLRTWLAGYKVMIATKAKVYHYGGVLGIEAEEEEPTCSIKISFTFCSRFYPPEILSSISPATYLFLLFMSVLHAFIVRDPLIILQHIKGVISNVLNFDKILLEKRKIVRKQRRITLSSLCDLRILPSFGRHCDTQS